MYNFQIGVLIDSFRTEHSIALKKAAGMGIKGIQVYSTYGSMSPDNLNTENRREFVNMVKDNGMVISALCGDLGQGFADKEKNPQLIEMSKKILNLAKDLETNIVTTHIGVVPTDKDCERYKIMQEACYELSRYADSLNAHFAIETGPEPSATLKSFLDTLGSTGVAVNLDPANLVMVTGDDPVKAVYTLKDYIVHTHAKDGRMLMNIPENEITVDIKDAIAKGYTYIELPLGQGKVDWVNYLKALDEIGYNGFLTIEREVGNNPEGDIKLAVDFLNEMTK